MDAPEDPIVKTREDARAGASTHMTRVILPVSLGLVVIAFIILLLIRGF